MTDPILNGVMQKTEGHLVTINAGGLRFTVNDNDIDRHGSLGSWFVREGAEIMQVLEPRDGSVHVPDSVLGAVREKATSGGFSHRVDGY